MECTLEVALLLVKTGEVDENVQFDTCDHTLILAVVGILFFHFGIYKRCAFKLIYVLLVNTHQCVHGTVTCRARKITCLTSWGNKKFLSGKFFTYV